MTTSTLSPFRRSRLGLRATFGPAMAALALFALVPAVAIVVLSFTDIRSIPLFPTHWVGWDNYTSFFSPGRWRFNLTAVQHTLTFAGVATVAINVLGVVIAAVLNQKLPGRNFFRALVFLPTVLGVTVIGLIWKLVFNPSAGPAASIWSLFGADSAFLGDRSLALGLVIFVAIWSGMGVTVVIYIAGLQAISGEMYEAADVDGANAVQKLRLVTVPMLAPSITANVLLTLVGTLQSYQLAYVLTGASNPATAVLSLLVFAEGFGGGANASGTAYQSQGYGAAISMLQFLLVGAITLVVMTYLRRRETQL